MVSESKLEQLSLPVSAPDGSGAFRHEYIESTVGARLPSAGDQSASVAPPAGINSEGWAQISEMIGQDKTVNFTAGDDGQVPDYILGADGTLTKNPDKTTPNADGSVTVQVQSNEGMEAARRAAQQLQVAAVQEKIAYWQAAHPGDTDIPEFLKGMLASAQTAAAEPGVASERPRQESPRQTEAPQSVGNPGGYSGGGPPEQLGHSNIGSAPRGGYRQGSFEPNAPIDRTAIPKPVEGDLAIKGPPSCTVEQIQTFLEKMGSPAAKEKGFSQALYTACTDRGIDPAVAVGFFLQESTCGRYGRAHENMSLGNIKGSAPESGGTDGTFRRYGSWAEGARDWARLIDESYAQKRGLSTLSQVISVYAPSSDGNNERQYVATVKGVVENFKNQKGDNTRLA